MKFLFNVHDVIKIPGKNFEELSINEVALMIEADSSISPDGNEYFASCALDEFLHNTKLKREDLREVQSDILKHIYIEGDSSRTKKVNTEYLKLLASKLKSKSSIDSSSSSK
jgi:hypothetical protein